MAGRSGGGIGPVYVRNARKLVGVRPCDASVRRERWVLSAGTQGQGYGVQKRGPGREKIKIAGLGSLTPFGVWDGGSMLRDTRGYPGGARR